MEKKVYNAEEVRKILGISLSTLRRAIAEGRIKTFRIGRLLKISAEELDKFTKEEKKVFSVQEAANLLYISIVTLRKLIRERKLKAFRMSINGPYRITQEEIDRLIRGESNE